jgi:hypothetical protein
LIDRLDIFFDGNHGFKITTLLPVSAMLRRAVTIEGIPFAVYSSPGIPIEKVDEIIELNRHALRNWAHRHGRVQ